jgi:hypothetical protein
VDSIDGAVDRRATGPPWIDDHCRVRELSGARPSAAPVAESFGQGAGEGKEGSPRVGRQWRGVTVAVLGLAMAVTSVELRSGRNERGRMSGWCLGGGGCLGAFYRAEGRSRAIRPLKGRWWHSGSPL